MDNAIKKEVAERLSFVMRGVLDLAGKHTEEQINAAIEAAASELAGYIVMGYADSYMRGRAACGVPLVQSDKALH